MDNVSLRIHLTMIRLTRFQDGVTYLAGCTDPDYEDSACPDKGDFGGMYCFPSSKIHVLTMPTLDQTWAGLVYCNGTSNEWVACQDSGSTISVPSSCWCPSTSRTVAFTDSPILNNIMSLPASQGSSVTWEDVSAYASAHSLTSTSSNPVASSSNSLTQILPPLSVSATLPSTVSPSGQSSLPSSTAAIPPSSTSAAVASTRGGLNTGEKVGIALGSAAAAVILLLLGLLAFRRMRQRQTEESPKPPMMDLTRPISGDAQPDPDMRSPAWSGHKSELAADESTSVSPAPLYQDFTSRPQSVEVESQAARPSPARLTHDGGYTMPGHKGTYYEMAG